MIKVEFIYKGYTTYIPAEDNEKFREICSKFKQKAQLNIDEAHFLYSGRQINLDSTLCQIINKTDKERKVMSILVYDIYAPSNKVSLIQSPDIICPICKEPARFEVKNHRIKIYNCKYGHIKEDILLSELENTQLIDESKIKCDKCKLKNKSNTFNKEMYICNICNMNLCPFCKSEHDKKHKIINYEDKYYICNKHNKEYYSYCEECKKDICLFCEAGHEGHNIISYSKILTEEIEEVGDIKYEINAFLHPFKTKIKMIIFRLNNIMKNYETYFNFIVRNIENYNPNSINYNKLQNINYIKNSKEEETYKDFIKDYENIESDNNYKEFIPRILNLYNEFNRNEIDLVYYIPKENNKIRIFGKSFVENNKDLCKIIYENKEFNLNEYYHYDYKNIKNNLLKIKLKGINNVTNLHSIFKECSLLSHHSDFSNWDTTYVTDMSYLFYHCKFYQMPDISKFNTTNVGDMSVMFSDCSLLKYLPDISNWNISNATNLTYIFHNCSSLETMPDISKFELKNLDSLDSIFSGCSSLKSLPDISKWDTKNVKNMSYLFYGCSSLKSLPDISKWDTKNVVNMSSMFSGCSSLVSLPDISKWETSNVVNMSSMFSGCSSLVSLPDISKWDINKTLKYDQTVNMFEDCAESLGVPKKFKNFGVFKII